MLCTCVIDFGKEIVQETIEKIIQIKQRIQAAHDRQKSYADLKRKPMEFQVRDRVMLKVLPWKRVICFGIQGKLSRVHNTFHVSNLKKCYADEPLAIPLDGLHFDDKLHFVEEPVEIMDREVKRLRQSRVPIFKEISKVQDKGYIGGRYFGSHALKIWLHYISGTFVMDYNLVTLPPSDPYSAAIHFRGVTEIEQEEDNPGNTNSNPQPQPNPFASIAIEQVRKLNSMLELLGLVPQSSNLKFICSKEDDVEVMFIEIIRDDDEPQNEDPNEGDGATTGEPIVEYFDTFPTRNELT
ncbi:hypothetical protein Tco_0282906 [Tanacetum coccineum]